MYMGQRHGKQAKLTPLTLQSTSNKNINNNNNNVHQLSSTNQQQQQAATATTTLLAPGANEPPQTGNLVITIRMLTMNSNEVNNTSSSSSTTTLANSGGGGVGGNSNNYNSICSNNSKSSTSDTKNEIVDQSNDNQVSTHKSLSNGSSSSSSCTSTTSSNTQNSEENDPQQRVEVAVCDNQQQKTFIIPTFSHSTSSSSPSTSFINNNNSSPSTTTTTSTSNGSSSLTDKISNMLSRSCKLGNSSAPVLSVSSASTVPSSNSSHGTASKVKVKKSNWSLGKLTGRSKRDKKQINKDNVLNNDDGASGVDLNTSSASTSSLGSEKLLDTRTPDESIRNGASESDATTSLLFPQNSSIQILNGPSSTTGSGATAAAFILPAEPLASTATPTATAAAFIHHFDSTRATLYGSLSNGTSGGNFILVSPFIDVTRAINPDEISSEDCDEQARWRRALQIAQGIEAPPDFVPNPPSPQSPPPANAANTNPIGNPIWQTLALCQSTDPASFQTLVMQKIQLPHGIVSIDELPRVHSQADYIHCLVPDLGKIISCCFYWGKMDRFEAEKLLDGKPEGTFLLRDSAQEEFLFSVSFRKYGRSLHARIEQFNHEFSFDSHDPGVYTSPTVTGLLEHYKDPSCVMFFEPMLTLPLHRNFVFSLQELARASIVSSTTYDGIDKLDVPRMMKSYLKEYHYKQRVHYKRFDDFSDMDS